MILKSPENVLVVLAGMENPLDGHTVSKRTIKDQDVLKARHSPHSHARELSFAYFEWPHIRHRSEVAKRLVGGPQETAGEVNTRLLGEPYEVVRQVPLRGEPLNDAGHRKLSSL